MYTQLKVGLCYNLEKQRTADDPFDLNAEFDSPQTVLGIKTALEAGGHKVICLEADQQFYHRLIEVKDQIDIVFNVAEGYSGESRESIYPAFFEFFKIPYTGSPPAVLSIALNKDAVKKIWFLENIPTPAFQTIHDMADLSEFALSFPVIAKPVHEGTSKGITNDSFIENQEQLHSQVRTLLKTYSQDVILEEFIHGREFEVSILGNGPYDIFPPSETDYSHLPAHLHHFSSYEAKTDFDIPEASICPADITPEEESSLKRISLAAYKSINCRDFGRCDLRMDQDGNLFVLEINALPGISAVPEVNHTFPIAGSAYGYDYMTLINKILNTALHRYRSTTQQEKL